MRVAGGRSAACAFLAGGETPGGDGRQKMFKVMTWNLENLFRPGGPSGPADPDIYKAKLHGLAGTINGQAPDVLAVQEVGDPDALADLVALLGWSWHRRVAGHGGHLRCQVGGLSTHAVSAPAAVDLLPVN